MALRACGPVIRSDATHDLFPGRRVELRTFASVALKRRQMLHVWVRPPRTCRWPGVSKPSHFRPSVVALPTIPLFPIQEQTLALQPQNILHHSLAYDTRLFHAEKGILRETLVEPASGDACNFGLHARETGVTF